MFKVGDIVQRTVIPYSVGVVVKVSSYETGEILYHVQFTGAKSVWVGTKTTLKRTIGWEIVIDDGRNLVISDYETAMKVMKIMFDSFDIKHMQINKVG